MAAVGVITIINMGNKTLSVYRTLQCNRRKKVLLAQKVFQITIRLHFIECKSQTSTIYQKDTKKHFGNPYLIFDILKLNSRAKDQ